MKTPLNYDVIANLSLRFKACRNCSETPVTNTSTHVPLLLPNFLIFLLLIQYESMPP